MEPRKSSQNPQQLSSHEKLVCKPTPSAGLPKRPPTIREVPTGRRVFSPSSHFSEKRGKRGDGCSSPSPPLSHHPSSSSSFVSCPRGSPDSRWAARPTPKILHMIPFCFMHPKWFALRWQGLQQIIAGENRRLGLETRWSFYFYWLWGQGDSR